MKRSVFVTGGAGFVGANLVRRLFSEGYQVHIAIRQTGSLWRLEDALNQLVVHTDVLSDRRKLNKVLVKIQPKAIFHLASHGAYPSQQNVETMIESNVIILSNLLEASRYIDYEHFIISGSSSEYGYTSKPMKESDCIEPNSMYAVTKAAATHMAVYFAKTNHKPIHVFRFFNVYGYWEEEGRLVRSVIESALKNEPILLATGREARDFIFAGDVSDAYTQTLKIQKPLAGEIFNIGTGRQTTIYKLAQDVVRLTSSKSKILLNSYPRRSWDTFHWQADTTKTKKVLGWKAVTSLEDGLKKTIEWYRKNAKC